MSTYKEQKHYVTDNRTPRSHEMSVDAFHLGEALDQAMYLWPQEANHYDFTIKPENGFAWRVVVYQNDAPPNNVNGSVWPS